MSKIKKKVDIKKLKIYNPYSAIDEDEYELTKRDLGNADMRSSEVSPPRKQNPEEKEWKPMLKTKA